MENLALIAQVQANTAIAVGLIFAFAALGTGIGFGLGPSGTLALRPSHFHRSLMQPPARP